MSLTVPIEDLSRLVIFAELSKIGQPVLSIKMQSSSSPENANSIPSGIYVSFERTMQNGRWSLAMTATSERVEFSPSSTSESLFSDFTSEAFEGLTHSSAAEWLNSLAPSTFGALPGAKYSMFDSPLKNTNFFGMMQQDNTSEHPMQTNLATAFSSSLPTSHQQSTPACSAFSPPVPDSQQTQSVAHLNPMLALGSSPEQPEEDSETTFVPQGSSGEKRIRRLPCLSSLCKKKFMSEHTRQQHMKTHQHKKRRYLPCTMGCNEHFSRQHDRFRHEVMKHGFQSEWTCDKCQRFFSSERSLKSHRCSPAARWKMVQQKDIQSQSE